MLDNGRSKDDVAVRMVSLLIVSDDFCARIRVHSTNTMETKERKTETKETIDRHRLPRRSATMVVRRLLEDFSAVFGQLSMVPSTCVVHQNVCGGEIATRGLSVRKVPWDCSEPARGSYGNGTVRGRDVCEETWRSQLLMQQPRCFGNHAASRFFMFFGVFSSFRCLVV